MVEREKVVHRLHRLGGGVDFSRLHPLEQLFRFDIDQFHLVGFVKARIEDALAYAHGRDGGDRVVQAFQMLHVDGRVHVDAGVEQLLDVFVPFVVAA